MGQHASCTHKYFHSCANKYKHRVSVRRQSHTITHTWSHTHGHTHSCTQSHTQSYNSTNHHLTDAHMQTLMYGRTRTYACTHARACPRAHTFTLTCVHTSTCRALCTATSAPRMCWCTKVACGSRTLAVRSSCSQPPPGCRLRGAEGWASRHGQTLHLGSSLSRAEGWEGTHSRMLYPAHLFGGGQGQGRAGRQRRGNAQHGQRLYPGCPLPRGVTSRRGKPRGQRHLRPWRSCPAASSRAARSRAGAARSRAGAQGGQGSHRSVHRCLVHQYLVHQYLGHQYLGPKSGARVRGLMARPVMKVAAWEMVRMGAEGGLTRAGLWAGAGRHQAHQLWCVPWMGGQAAAAAAAARACILGMQLVRLRPQAQVARCGWVGSAAAAAVAAAATAAAAVVARRARRSPAAWEAAAQLPPGWPPHAAAQRAAAGGGLVRWRRRRRGLLQTPP